MEDNLENHTGVALDNMVPEASDEPLTHQAELYLASGELDKAKAVCHRAIEVNSECWLAHHHLGRVFFREGDTDAAIACYHRAIALNPNFWSYQGLGEALFNHGQLDNAIYWFQQAIELDATVIWSHLYLGEALALKNKIDAAISCFYAGVEQDPMCSRCHYRLGDALMVKGQVEQAVAAYRQAGVFQETSQWTNKQYIFTQDWFTPNISLWLKHLQHLIGQPDVNALEIGSFEGMSACWLLENVLTHESARITCVDPYLPYPKLQNPIWLHLKFAETLFNFNLETSTFSHKVTRIKATSSEILPSLQPQFYDFIYVDGDHKPASVLLDAAAAWNAAKVGAIIIFDDYGHSLAFNPNQKTQTGIDIFLWIFLSHLDVLHKGYQLVIRKKSHVEDYTIYYKLGLALAQLGQVDAAIANYRRSIQLNSEYYWAHQKLGEILISINHLKEAITYYKRAIELDPKAHLSYLYLAQALERNYQLQEAVDHYRYAIECKPDSFIAYYHLGSVLVKLRQFTPAVQALQNAIDLNPEFNWSHYLLGDALSIQGQWDEAIPYYRRAIELKPDFFGSYNGLGNALCYGGQSFRVYTWVKDFLIETGRIDEAIKCYQKAIELNPNHFHSHLRMGNALTAKTNTDEAIRCYQKACYYKVIQTKPDLADIEWNYSQAHSPNFLIIGAGKAGTTSLFEYLIKHPNILPPAQKEIDFFNHFFEEGTSWYLSHFPPNFSDRQFTTGEASPSYFIFPNTAQRVFSLFPRVKIILLLRNPAERTISHYYENVKSGQEKRSLEEAVLSEIKLLETAQVDDLINGAYVDRAWGYALHSLYVYPLQKWMDFFPKEQILILRSEDLYNNSDAIVNQVFNFLELAPYHLDNYPIYYSRVRSSTSQDSPHSSLFYQMLTDYYKPHISKLEEYLDRGFNWS